jgi:hypothetical protein
VEGVRDYFGGGDPLLQAFSATPMAEWKAKLASAPWQRVWLVAPAARNEAEARQQQAFVAALQQSGFTQQQHLAAGGYPLTQVGLFVRPSS